MKMTGDTAFMACPDVIDAVPGFRSIVLLAQATERSELEGQDPGLLTEHTQLHKRQAEQRLPRFRRAIEGLTLPR